MGGAVNIFILACFRFNAVLFRKLVKLCCKQSDKSAYPTSVRRNPCRKTRGIAGRPADCRLFQVCRVQGPHLQLLRLFPPITMAHQHPLYLTSILGYTHAHTQECEASQWLHSGGTPPQQWSSGGSGNPAMPPFTPLLSPP